MHQNSRVVADALAGLAPGAEVRELDASTRTAAEAAAALGCEVGAIANSLVFMAADGPVLIMTSGAHRVDLALVSVATGLASLRRATPEEVRAATGQPIGGVAPVGHPEPLRTLVDRDLARYPTVWAAAGTPHSVFATTYGQLLAITKGRPVQVAA
jgi:prolyl-tRNA editing enzyme YbaK/EbsC (Cys-tRNA(Pro) deacylase)